MSTFRMVSAFCAVTAMSLALSASRIYADTPENRSEVTFYQPMQVPGGVLAPGSYVFTLTDSASGGYIVNVFNANKTELVASLSAVANPRLEQPQNDKFVYWETLQGWPQAVRAWFCPGDNVARELQYSAEEATVLSAVINQNVPMPAAEPGVDPEGMPLPIQNAELDALEPDTAAQLNGGSQWAQEAGTESDGEHMWAAAVLSSEVTGEVTDKEEDSIPPDMPGAIYERAQATDIPPDVPSPIAELAQATGTESDGEHMWAAAVLSSEVTGEVTDKEEDSIPPDMPGAIYERAQATDIPPDVPSPIAELAQATGTESDGEHMWADAALSSEVTGEVTGKEVDIIPPDMPPAIYELAPQPESPTVELAGLEPAIPASVVATIAQLAQTTPPNIVMEREPTRALELPKTASYLPLCGLLGLLSLGAASAIRLLRD